MCVGVGDGDLCFTSQQLQQKEAKYCMHQQLLCAGQRCLEGGAEVDWALEEENPNQGNPPRHLDSRSQNSRELLSSQEHEKEQAPELQGLVEVRVRGPRQELEPRQN